MSHWLKQCYDEVWLVDFEYGCIPGELSEVRCMVARELFSQRLMLLWEDRLKVLSQPPFRTDQGALFVAYLASAELGCFQVLGWPPRNESSICTWSSRGSLADLNSDREGD